ncbi:hypothetical protein C4D60_Mb05t06130 [Musa balbisiana]|uniref:Uncharacterized protein n=1 Tax=Musa balbisiana TaxID=52838 RepID=A0A4S8JU14_MUSBA|nr:hypothetical protein C4D60_Mb05t06130 [Musa balbisiana]
MAWRSLEASSRRGGLDFEKSKTTNLCFLKRKKKVEEQSWAGEKFLGGGIGARGHWSTIWPLEIVEADGRRVEEAELSIGDEEGLALLNASPRSRMPSCRGLATQWLRRRRFPSLDYVTGELGRGEVRPERLG